MTDHLKDELLEIMVGEIRKAAEFRGFDKIPAQLKAFETDPVWPRFGFANRWFLTRRNIGNYYTAIFRKIGDLFEKSVRAIIAHQLNLRDSDLEYTFDVIVDGTAQKRSLDASVDVRRLSEPNRTTVEALINSIDHSTPTPSVIVIEIRGCYMIGDAKRIQADEHAARAAREAGLVPVLLVMCSTSLKNPIKRHRRNGYWKVYEGVEAFQFLERLTGFDLLGFLNENSGRLSAEMERVLKKFDS